MRHLNGWYRIGIVLTGLWLLLVVLFLVVAYTDKASDFVSITEGAPAVCSGVSDPSGRTFTLEEAMGGCAPGMEISPATADSKRLLLAPSAALLLLPPLLGWVLALAAVKAVRWIAEGFRGTAT
jgi:hypothetical protein